MRVLCINDNGWYEHERKMCGYLFKRDGIKGYMYGDICDVISSRKDEYGDLFYRIGYQWWEAEFFIPIQEQETEIELLENKLETINN